MSMLLTLMVPLLGTGFGAATVFFMRGALSPLVRRSLAGFAAGVMIAASVWSLLLPCIELSASLGLCTWVPAALGLLCGVGFLLLLDRLVPRLLSQRCGQRPTRLSTTAMLIIAVTIHNVPEGMAVGVACAGSALQTAGLTTTAAFALSMGISIQNFPEGAIISLPLRAEGMRTSMAFLLGLLSGLVEPLAGGITVLFVAHLTGVLPYLLSFAAGAMLYVVLSELIPDAQQEDGAVGTISAALGFTLMMVLDEALG